jgi:hypothetical protein
LSAASLGFFSRSACRKFELAECRFFLLRSFWCTHDAYAIAGILEMAAFVPFAPFAPYFVYFGVKMKNCQAL